MGQGDRESQIIQHLKLLAPDAEEGSDFQAATYG
jgi:hypothetical protein